MLLSMYTHPPVIIAVALMISIMAMFRIKYPILFERKKAKAVKAKAVRTAKDLAYQQSRKDADKLNHDGDATEADKIANMIEIYETIIKGAKSFLLEEYKICAAFIVVVGALVFVMVSHAGTCTEAQYVESHFRNASGVFPDPKAVLSGWNFKAGGITAASFAIGGITSMVSGYLGMMVRYTRAGEEERGGEAANARLEARTRG